MLGIQPTVQCYYIQPGQIYSLSSSLSSAQSCLGSAYLRLLPLLTSIIVLINTICVLHSITQLPVSNPGSLILILTQITLRNQTKSVHFAHFRYSVVFTALLRVFMVSGASQTDLYFHVLGSFYTFLAAYLLQFSAEVEYRDFWDYEKLWIGPLYTDWGAVAYHFPIIYALLLIFTLAGWLILLSPLTNFHCPKKSKIFTEISSKICWWRGVNRTTLIKKMVQIGCLLNTRRWLATCSRPISARRSCCSQWARQSEWLLCYYLWEKARTPNWIGDCSGVFMRREKGLH